MAGRVRLLLEIDNQTLISMKNYDTGEELQPVDCGEKVAPGEDLKHLATLSYSIRTDCCIIWKGRCYSC